MESNPAHWPQIPFDSCKLLRLPFGAGMREAQGRRVLFRRVLVHLTSRVILLDLKLMLGLGSGKHKPGPSDGLPILGSGFQSLPLGVL